MHATHDTLSENISTQSAERLLRRRDSDVADPPLRLNAWRNGGGAGRPKPL